MGRSEKVEGQESLHTEDGPQPANIPLQRVSVFMAKGRTRKNNIMWYTELPNTNWRSASWKPMLVLI